MKGNSPTCIAGCGQPTGRSRADYLTVGMCDSCWMRRAALAVPTPALLVRAVPENTPQMSRCAGCGAWIPARGKCTTCVRLVRTNFAGST